MGDVLTSCKAKPQTKPLVGSTSTVVLCTAAIDSAKCYRQLLLVVRTNRQWWTDALMQTA